MKLLLFGVILILFAMFMNSIASGMNQIFMVVAIAGLAFGIAGVTQK